MKFLLFVACALMSFNIVTDVAAFLAGERVNVLITLSVALLLSIVGFVPKKSFAIYFKYRKWIFGLAFLSAIKLSVTYFL